MSRIEVQALIADSCDLSFAESEHGIEHMTFEQLKLDSLGVVALAREIEDAFSIEIPDAELTYWTCVRDVCDSIERIKGAR